MKPEVDVLIPTYNRGLWLIRAIQSVFWQREVNARVVVYDDGSTDETSDMLCASYGCDRILFGASAENRGAGYARARLLEMASAPFACWLDSDDLMHPERCLVQCAVMKRMGVNICGTQESSFRQDLDRVKGAWAWSQQPPGNIGYTPHTMMFRTDLAKQVPMRDVRLMEDCEWLAEWLARHGEGCLIPRVLYFSGRGRLGRLGDKCKRGAEVNSYVGWMRQGLARTEELLAPLEARGLRRWERWDVLSEESIVEAVRSQHEAGSEA